MCGDGTSRELEGWLADSRARVQVLCVEQIENRSILWSSIQSRDAQQIDRHHIRVGAAGCLLQKPEPLEVRARLIGACEADQSKTVKAWRNACLKRRLASKPT
jgi:hypothetical protein